MHTNGISLDENKISERAAFLVSQSGLPQDVRVSAIHTCVDQNHGPLLSDLRNIALDPTLVSTLRKAAIHAIWQLGTAEDVELLDALPQDDENLPALSGPQKMHWQSAITGLVIDP